MEALPLIHHNEQITSIVINIYTSQRTRKLPDCCKASLSTVSPFPYGKIKDKRKKMEENIPQNEKI